MSIGSLFAEALSYFSAWIVAGRADRSSASCDRDVDVFGATCNAGSNSLESVFSSRLIWFLDASTSLGLQNCAFGSLRDFIGFRHVAASSRADFDALDR